MDVDKYVRAQAWSSVIIALFTIVLAGVGMQQCYMYRASERPWIGPISRTLNSVEETGKFHSLEWRFTNGGKSPAINVRFNLNLYVGERIPPGDPAQIKIPEVSLCSSSKPLPGEGAGPVIPGVPQTFAAYAPQNVVDSTESIKANKIGLYFVGCVDYEGPIGKDYRTWVCEYFEPTAGVFRACHRSSGAR